MSELAHLHPVLPAYPQHYRGIAYISIATGVDTWLVSPLEPWYPGHG